MRIGRVWMILACAGLATSAAADPTTVGNRGGFIPTFAISEAPSPSQAGGGGPDGTARGAVVAMDHATLGLMMFADQSTFAFVNSGGDVSIKRNTDFLPIGTLHNGTDTVVARWNENATPFTNKVQVIWKTQNGREMLPANSMVQGRPAPFLGWRLGAMDPVTFHERFAPINLISVVVRVSSDLGQTFDATDLTPFFLPRNPWNGTDTGLVLPLRGQGINMIITEYEYQVIPAPSAGMALLVAAAGFVCKRRRR